jgi:signal peptidase II
MKQRDWVRLAALVVSVLAVDQITKSLALRAAGGDWGLVRIGVQFNIGAFLGSFAGYSPILRVVSLSTLGASLVFWFLVLQWFLPGKLLQLRAAFGLLLAGVLGNVIDRIIRGMVVDFMQVRAGSFESPVFNMADVFQWVANVWLVVGLVRNRKELWPDRNERKSLWVNTPFQLLYSGRLVALGLCFALVTGTLSYTYLRMVLEKVQLPGAEASTDLLRSFAITFGLTSITFCAFLFAVGIVLSHRAAGPLYAFERFLEDLLNGKSRPLKLRAGDEFQHLEELAGSIEKRFKDIKKKG